MTVGTNWETMIDVGIDDLGTKPSRAGMPNLATWTFASAIRFRLEVCWDHCRGSRRGDDGWRLWFARFLGQGQQGKNDRFLALAVDIPSLLLCECRAERNRSSKGLVHHRLGSIG